MCKGTPPPREQLHLLRGLISHVSHTCVVVLIIGGVRSTDDHIVRLNNECMSRLSGGDFANFLLVARNNLVSSRITTS